MLENYILHKRKNIVPYDFCRRVMGLRFNLVAVILHDHIFTQVRIMMYHNEYNPQSSNKLFPINEQI